MLTEKTLEKIGIPFTRVDASDKEVSAALRVEGFWSAPVVKVDFGNGASWSWHDFRADYIRRLGRIFRGETFTPEPGTPVRGAATETAVTAVEPPVATQPVAPVGAPEPQAAAPEPASEPSDSQPEPQPEPEVSTETPEPATSGTANNT